MRYIKITLLIITLATIALAATHGNNLTWTPSTSSGVTSQLVCRGTTAGSENCAAPIATIPNNTTTTFLDSTGTAGTTYFYVVEACAGTVCSVPSNEVNAVFPIVPNPPTNLGVAQQ